MKKQKKSHSEHPWDIDTDSITIFRGILFTLVIVFSLLTAQPLFAQIHAVPPVPSEPELDEIKKLTRVQLQIVDDYREILDRLEFHINDYIGYYSEHEHLHGRKSLNELLKVLVKLEQGIYNADVNKLSNDLAQLVDYLNDEEKQLKNSKSTRHLYKLTRNLRREIELLEDDIEDEISIEIRENTESIKVLKQYLEKERQFNKSKKEYYIEMVKFAAEIQAQIAEQQKYHESLKITLNTEYLIELEETVKLQEELKKICMVYVDESLEDMLINIYVDHPDSSKVDYFPPIVPDMPDIPDVPHISYKSDKASKTKQYIDSLVITSSKTPIYIKNDIGSLKIKGWNKNKLFVKFSVDVVADSRSNANTFIDEISLKLVSNKSGISVSSKYPSLSDANRQIVSSSMVLYVPKKNIITCKNSFGRTLIENIDNNVILTAKNSETVLENIRGNIEAVTKNGSNSFIDIEGSIHLKGSKSEVSIENCQTSIDIVNSYAPITIESCEGITTVHNSGDIYIYDHTGNLDIENKNGTIKAAKISGNLKIINSFQPLYVHSVEGSVTIENKKSLIDLIDISGPSTVTNQGGSINATNVTGPINFTNNTGETFLNLDGALAGYSKIKSDYGTINLILSNQSDIFVNASTEGGKILSSFGNRIEHDDYLSKTVLSLGNASQTLDIEGTNATIIISDTK